MESSWDEENLQALVDYILPRLTESKLQEEMVRMAREGRWEKEKVQALLCQKSTEGTIILSILDFSTQKEVALWNPWATSRITHLMVDEFTQWFLLQATETTPAISPPGGSAKKKTKGKRKFKPRGIGGMIP